MLSLATVQVSVFNIAHLLRIATPEHLGYQAIIVGRLVAWMGMLKRLPVIRKDLLEDTPIPKGLGQHRVAPSWGDMIVVMQRLYHASPASSTPHQPLPGRP